MAHGLGAKKKSRTQLRASMNFRGRVSKNRFSLPPSRCRGLLHQGQCPRTLSRRKSNPSLVVPADPHTRMVAHVTPSYSCFFRQSFDVALDVLGYRVHCYLVEER